MERPRPKHLAPLLAGLTAGSVLAGILVAFTPAPTPPAGDTDASLALAALSRNISAPLVESAQRAALMPMAAPAIQAAPRVAAVGSGGGVLGMVNSERAAAGCPPLRFDPQLASMAQSHASDMASRDYFAHSSGADGENIAYGQTSSAEVMQEWMNSPGHRANILNCEYTRFGAGYDSAGNYWVQEFGY